MLYRNALFREAGTQLQLLEAAPPLRDLASVQRFVERHESEQTVIAVDGPLVIPNATGQRRCELEVSRHFGARHASCHSSNLTLYPDPCSVRFATWLQARGFRHADQALGGRVMLEVYPHAAYVALFELHSIIPYKKGSVAAKVGGLRIVQQTLAKLPFVRDDRMNELIEFDPGSLKGQARKSFEDVLDALFCAYLAFYFVRYGPSASQIFGSGEEGYIVNPAVPLAALSAAAA